MALTQKQLAKIVKKFADGSYTDETLQSMMTELHETELLTGVKDELIMGRIFTYLDTKLQEEIRSKIKE